MPLDSKKIYDVLYELKGDHEKAKEEFIKCFDFAIYTKIKKQYDTKLFFKYLQDKNHSSWKQLLARVNNIIATESPNYEEEIDAVLNLVSDERKNYSIDTLLKFCKKILLPQAYEVLSKSLNSPSIQTFEDMDRIFQAITGRPYVYFLDRYDYYIEKKYLQHIFDKWKAPKFKITPTVSKGPVRMPTATSATKIIGNERLEKIHRMTQEVQDNVLKNDKDVLAGIYSKMYPGENTNVLFSFWENNMYKHLQDTNKRPRERNALLAATVWVFLRTYKNYKGPITNFVTNIKEQNSAKKIYDELDPKYFEPREDYGPLIESIRNLITEKGVNIEQSIYDNIKNELTKSRATTVTKKTKIIYNILKPIMKSRITMGLIENAIKGLV